jgi:tetratricopeptide (TPR) repeat protein
MAEFIPWAGFSPICEAVLVQTEHWANAGEANRLTNRIITNMREQCFIRLQSYGDNIYLTENKRSKDQKIFNLHMLNKAMMKQILPFFIFILICSSAFAQLLPREKAKEFYRTAMAYKEKEMFTEALITFNKAIRVDNTFDSAYVEAGNLYLRTNSFDTARMNFRKAVELSPKMVSANLALAKLYRDYIPNYDSSIYLYNVALKADSLNKEIYHGLAWCYNAKQEYEKSIPYSVRALEIDNGYRKAYGELGHSFAKLKWYAQAVEQFKKNLAISVVDMALYYSGLAYTQLNDKENALKQYETLKPLNDRMATSLKKTIDKMN